jgi:putative restriction endonuclease
VKAVFDIKPGSGYDDEPGSRYQFPDKKNYLAAALDAVGDWILYREPKRNEGRQAYVAVARVIRVEPDSDRSAHHVAHLNNFLEFPRSVPFVANERYAESSLRSLPDRRLAGQWLQGRSMRPIPDEDFAAIVLEGLGEVLAQETAARLGIELPSDLSDLTGFAEPIGRRVEQMLINRTIREASFRLEVCRAYDDTCAITGLKIINGGGRAEVQAAHIKPVSSGGPDIVRNGIALSSTVHWLFDRHLISIDPDYRLLVAHNRVPHELRTLFRPDDRGLRLPTDRRLWPHPIFLDYHREMYANAAH